MKYLFASKNKEVLAQLAWSRVLLAFDFDGTLAPIVHDRNRAQPRSKTLALLVALCKQYPCAVISGRGVADVSQLLGRAKVRYVVGNHGLEPGGDLAGARRKVARASTLLQPLTQRDGGIEVEDKQYSLALHYRRSRTKRAARSLIEDAIAKLPVRMRVIPGKLVVNLVPEGAPNKGAALLRLRRAARADTALYVGDDVTDEDVFELDEPGRLLGVRVGPKRSSAAAYYLKDQREIDRLLFTLLELRAP